MIPLPGGTTLLVVRFPADAVFRSEGFDPEAAFREQMKLNHPDKVAHLSPALQKFAEAQVLKIKDAYERLARGR